MIHIKAIIVTGGSRGIGFETSRSILEKGHSVLATGRTKTSPAIQLLLQMYQERFEYFCIDHLQEKSSRLVYEECIKKFGRVDGALVSCIILMLFMVGLVLNAGSLMPIGRMETVNIADFKKLLDLNVVVPLEMIQVCLAELRLRKGSIILVSSGASSKPYDAWGPYCISKAALNMLAGCVASEEPQVATIALRPGVVDTEMQNLIRTQGRDCGMSQQMHDYFTKLKADGKLLHPSVPSKVITDLVISPRLELSGQYMSWDKVPQL